jgi:hypothetical protein
MRGRLAIALSVSLVLIGFASWSRLSARNSAQPNLIAIAQLDTNPDEVLRDFLEPKSATTTAADSLTNTDMVGRQLILDYVQLAANGGANEDALSALAERYIDNVPSLITAEVVSVFDLKVVPNDTANFQAYAAALEAIYRSYATSLLGAYSADSLNLGAKGVSMSSKMSDIYAKTASRLKALSVPADVAKEHVALLNIYLFNASAMGALSEASADPARSFAGLIAFKANATHEQELLSKIEEILEDNDV